MKLFVREGLHVINEIPVEDMLFIDASISAPEHSGFVFVGEGGSGRVYRYKDYAIKIFHEHAKQDGDPPYPHDGYFLALLDRSPYFPSVYYYVDKEYMVVEFVEGTNIYDVDDSIFIKCVGELKEAINYAFTRGLVAADMSDTNIIVNQKGRPMIVDVGSFYRVYCDGELDSIVREYFRRHHERALADLINEKREG